MSSWCFRSILSWTGEEIKLGVLPAKSGNILEAFLYRGELPRGDAAAAVGATDRLARRIVSALMDRGVLTTYHPRAAALGISGDARLALDAGPVSRARRSWILTNESKSEMKREKAARTAGGILRHPTGFGRV
jgi:hypothetical protein